MCSDAGTPVEGILMLRRRRVKHTASLEARIAERVDEIRAKADALPLGSRERERLELRARQAHTANHHRMADIAGFKAAGLKGGGTTVPNEAPGLAMRATAGLAYSGWV